MGSTQQFQRNISLRLSEILSDAGVNDEVISRKREFTLLLESLNREPSLEVEGQSFHFFGGIYEGSSVIGGRNISNKMTVQTVCSYHVIQELADLKSDATNLLIVQDENTAPGYCYLQLLRSDVPNMATNVPDGEFHKDDMERVLMKSTTNENIPNVVRGGSMDDDMDLVDAFHCKSWPVEARPWLSRRSLSGWPFRQLKSECERSGYLIEPIGGIEWRVVMSFAERDLLFSLNITQVRCYALMKILLRTGINSVYDNAISSNMCKTALFYCVENTDSDVWQEHNLTLCLDLVLRELYKYVQNKNCPNFIIPEINLMAERISAEEQQHLLENIQHIINNKITVLLELQTGGIGVRLQQKMDSMLEDSDDVLDVCKKRRFSVRPSITILKGCLRVLAWFSVVYGWVFDV